MKRLKKFLYSAMLTSFVILGSVSVFANGLGGTSTPPDESESGGCSEVIKGEYIASADVINENTVTEDTNNVVNIDGYWGTDPTPTESPSPTTTPSSKEEVKKIIYKTYVVVTQEQYQECVETVIDGVVIDCVFENKTQV